MKLRPIKSKKEHEAFLEWVDELFEKKTKPASVEGQALQAALLLIKQYEDMHYPIPVPNTESV